MSADKTKSYEIMQTIAHEFFNMCFIIWEKAITVVQTIAGTGG
jgi:hypothetical protein